MNLESAPLESQIEERKINSGGLLDLFEQLNTNTNNETGNILAEFNSVDFIKLFNFSTIFKCKPEYIFFNYRFDKSPDKDWISQQSIFQERLT